MATQDELKGWFTVLAETANELAGEGLPEPERQRIRTLAIAAIRIGESVVLDINRIANAAEYEAPTVDSLYTIE